MTDTTKLDNRMIATAAGLHIIIGVAAVWGADCKQEYIHEYYEDEDGKPHRIPDYLHDTDAALTLLPLVGGEWFSWELRPAGIDLRYVCEIIDFTQRWRAEAATAAEAVARAWWRWMEAK